MDRSERFRQVGKESGYVRKDLTVRTGVRVRQKKPGITDCKEGTSGKRG